jgi:D-serine deaminase-like pyridoxal phosphate-dependent protein
MDDLSETVRLLYALKAQEIEDWRFGVALNALRTATAAEDDRDARAYLAEAGFEALPGFVSDMKGLRMAASSARPRSLVRNERMYARCATGKRTAQPPPICW